jgi:hypothetical protein
VSARNRENAIIALDELDNAELAELRQVRDFMVDFRLTDSGDLELQGFGESCHDDIWNRAYPVLAKAMAETPRSATGEPTSAGKKSIRAAVHAEKVCSTRWDRASRKTLTCSTAPWWRICRKRAF